MSFVLTWQNLITLISHCLIRKGKKEKKPVELTLFASVPLFKIKSLGSTPSSTSSSPSKPFDPLPVQVMEIDSNMEVAKDEAELDKEEAKGNKEEEYFNIIRDAGAARVEP